MNQEEKNCADDFNYFCKTYVKAVMSIHSHEKYGLLIPFEPYEYQLRYIKTIENNPCVITNSFRWSGLTTVNQFYLLWKCLFHKDQHCMSVFMTDRACCWDGSQTIRYAHDHFPDWLQEKFVKWNDHTYEFNNGSILNFLASDAALRRIRETTNYVTLDWLATWREDPNIFLNKLFTVTPNVKCSIVSPPNGIEGNSKTFYDLYCEAADNKGRFKIFELSYLENELFKNRKEQIKTDLGEKGFKQEMEGYFFTPSGEYLNPLCRS